MGQRKFFTIFRENYCEPLIPNPDLYRNLQALILNVILLSREYDNWKPMLAIETLGLRLLLFAPTSQNDASK